MASELNTRTQVTVSIDYSVYQAVVKRAHETKGHFSAVVQAALEAYLAPQIAQAKRARRAAPPRDIDPRWAGK